MKRLLTILIIILPTVIFGQPKEVRHFNVKDFPSSKYAIKLDTFLFQKFIITLTQVELRDIQSRKQNEFYWGAWINVNLNGETIDKYNFEYSYGEIEKCRGISAHRSPPNEKYFLISQKGLGNGGRLLIIDTTGRLYYRNSDLIALSKNTDLLFVIYRFTGDATTDRYPPDSIRCLYTGVKVFDMSNSRREEVFHIDNTCDYITDLYCIKNQYFGIVPEEIKDPKKITIINFDFKANKYTKAIVDKKYLKKATRLEMPCSCSDREP